MRIAILSDIHANLHALEAVAKEIRDRGVDEVWSLGDVVGYGGHPSQTLRWVEQHTQLQIKGNHDEAVASGDVTWFNPMAAHAARVHAHLLTPAERARVYAWPTMVRREIAGHSLLIVHASPDDPLHEYIQPQDARLGLRRWEGRADVILLGHTHRPFAARLRPSEGAAGEGAPRAAASDARRGVERTGVSWSPVGFREAIEDERDAASRLLIVNPGSVGQPRDADPRASYAILDLAAHKVELHRVTYDVEAAAQAILKEGLDQILALRLYEGR